MTNLVKLRHWYKIKVGEKLVTDNNEDIQANMQNINRKVMWKQDSWILCISSNPINQDSLRHSWRLDVCKKNYRVEKLHPFLEEFLFLLSSEDIYPNKKEQPEVWELWTSE